MRASTPFGGGECRAPLLKEGPKHQGHKGDTGVTPGPCGGFGEETQVGLVWVEHPGRWERRSPTGTRSHEDEVVSFG